MLKIYRMCCLYNKFLFNIFNYNYLYFYYLKNKTKPFKFKNNRNLKINRLFFKFLFLNTDFYNVDNMLYLFFKKSVNITIIDNTYKLNLPFFNYMYGLKNVSKNKDYFLINNKNLTNNNWFYFYKNFINNYNIKLIFFFDYKIYHKFSNHFLKLNVPIFSFIHGNLLSPFIDYKIKIISTFLSFYKILLLNLIIKNQFLNIKHFYKSIS